MKFRSRRIHFTNTPAAAARAMTRARTSMARPSSRRRWCVRGSKWVRITASGPSSSSSAWTVDTSVRVGRELAEELGRGGYLEDPTAGLEEMAAVRRQLLAAGIDTPLASNVAVTSFADIPRSVQLDAVQIILCDHHYWGGMTQVQHLARLAKTFGLGLSMHSNTHLGVSLMALAHVAPATPHLTYACDTHYPWPS